MILHAAMDPFATLLIAGAGLLIAAIVYALFTSPPDEKEHPE